jgi:hypothetical protein
MKTFTFYVDETHPKVNLIWVSTEGNLTLEKHIIEAETTEEAIIKLLEVINGEEPVEE